MDIVFKMLILLDQENKSGECSQEHSPDLFSSLSLNNSSINFVIRIFSPIPFYVSYIYYTSYR